MTNQWLHADFAFHIDRPIISLHGSIYWGPIKSACEVVPATVRKEKKRIGTVIL